jgi:Flp pilus assembly protein TadG
MTRPASLFAADAGNAAVEMALVLPLLLALLFGSVELGNYFYNEHILIKAVRDGARFAARQDMSYFTTCSGSPGGTVVTDTQNVVKTGLLSGGTNRMPFTGATINVTVACTKTLGSTTLGGIYTNVVNNSGAAVGAPVVTVTATVPYTSLLKSFGFTGVGYNLYATQQAAVAGW